jgi:crossover junction endodeoxyribonuclease RuvC
MGISSKQLAEVQDRLAGKRSAKRTDSVSATSLSLENTVLLGVDPSLRGTGFGVIKVGKSTNAAIDHGTIQCPSSWSQTRCLARISQTIGDVVQKHSPTICVIEVLFYAQNVQTALIMGQARGAALAVIASAGMEIYELAPRKVKQAIVGYGGAQKDAVAKMVQRQLGLSDQPDPDAADALALAIAFAQMQNRFSLASLKPI